MLLEKLMLLGLVCAVISGNTALANDATPPVLNFKMKALDGSEVDLAKYKGKVVLFVNVASRCGKTPQYAPLQKLHEKYAAQGLAIVGVPCNQFGGQEPGSNDQIRDFCTTRYGVEFDMLDKVDVNGDAAAPLYKYLTGSDTNPQFAGPVRWNFEKFLIGRDGRILARFGTAIEPDSTDVMQAIEAALAQ